MAYTTIDDPSAHFQILTYTGNGSSSRALTNTGNSDLQPDWLWVKRRDGTVSHGMWDSTRGAGKRLVPNSTDAEEDQSNVASFNSDGFTVNTGDIINTNTYEYVAWQWKAGGGSRTTFTESGNNPGGGRQVNTTAGFAIIDYTGTGAAGTVEHGLGAAPHWMMMKGREHVGGWINYHQQNTTDPKTDILELQSNAAAYDNSTYWNDTAPTSSVFTVNTSNDVNNDGNGIIAYVFTSIKGFSKFGGYRGNGNADGTFIYLGFKPAFFMCKQTNTSRSWTLIDNKRPTINNSGTKALVPNETGSEENIDADFCAMGLKIRQNHTAINDDGGNYVYMAFAEHPFVSSEGVPVPSR